MTKIAAAKPVLFTPDVQDVLGELSGSLNDYNNFLARDRAASAPRDPTLTHRVVQLSDVHIGLGRNPMDKTTSPTDDFTAESAHQFIAMLGRLSLTAADANGRGGNPTADMTFDVLSKIGKWANGNSIEANAITRVLRGPHKLHLALNGDFLDLLQAARLRGDYTYPSGFSDKEKKIPRPTPANYLTQIEMIHEGRPEIFQALAMLLRLGHQITYLPGNHDAALLNQKVWAGIYMQDDGTTCRGFRPLIADALRAQIALECRDKPDCEKPGRAQREQEVSQCLERLHMAPFAMFGDVFLQHGNRGDIANSTRRPLKERVDPAGWHDDIQLNLGDEGVRRSFLRVEDAEPWADARQPWQMAKKLGPAKSMMLARGFASALMSDGYDKSPQADQAQRVDDIREDVRRFGDEYLKNINLGRNPPLTKEQLAEGLIAMDQAAPTPFFSRVAKGAGFFTRMFAYLGEAADLEEVMLKQAVVANQHFGVHALGYGHDHNASFKEFVTADGKKISLRDSGTWMGQPGEGSRENLERGQKARDLVMWDFGFSQDGKLFREADVYKIPDGRLDGTFIRSEAYTYAEQKGARQQAEAIFEANRQAWEAFKAGRLESQSVFDKPASATSANDDKDSVA